MEGGLSSGEDWAFLPLILVLAFVARATFVLSTNLIHPDEVFQYLEQAHRLAFGYGFVPWEYQYGSRSWIIPGFIAIILKLLAALGLARPGIYQPVVQLVFCAISLSLPLCVYRIAQALLDEYSARLALVAAAFSYELVYFAHSPMSDALGVYSMFGALVWLFAPSRRHAALAFGLLAGLALALRFQLAPMIGAMLFFATRRWRGNGWPVLAGFLSVIVLAGALDAYTWGHWFSSIVSNVELNVFSGVASGFGTEPVYYYLLLLLLVTCGMAYLGAMGLALSRRTTWPLSVIGLIYLATMSAVAHKEPRFVLPLVPIYLIGLAAIVAEIERQPKLILGISLPGIIGARAISIFFVTGSIIGTALTLTGVHSGPAADERDDIRRAYLTLSQRTDVRGVIDDSGVRWYDTGGYYDLHLSVPIYRPDLPMTKIAYVRHQPRLFASHWLTRFDQPRPQGYALQARVGTIAIWHTHDDPAKELVAPGYGTYESIRFDRVVTPPDVTPRW